MGEDRVMLGSDYPFPLGELRVGKLVRDMQSLSDAARAKLLAGNAQRFLGLQ
jgi:aminocarboxymuconate-semialdehyde decarboxylase